ncbi:TnsA-like heteromeric transposase endonuclease subunit [Streptomyces sp. NBC_01003]|uniref:TnsA-like heteromeric transposase endonuclease subunit n=1 Tax=Streptomyces sp. NBC_01003 TaxID=2903714 RepID=UPI0038702D9E|nr:TnsA-like heteromeric transposase endonuclease subunit [Streptomyces sp. NBC_01003]
MPWITAATEVRFEHAPPVSAFPVVPGRRWGPGWWWSSTMGRHVAHGSAAMRAQLMLLDRDRQVVGLSGRPVRVVWRDERSRVRSWVPQVFARYADGSGLLADCPGGEGVGGVRAQRAQAVLEVVCGLVGWRYLRLAPLDAVMAANVRWLAGYRHPRYRGAEDLEEAVLDAFAQPRPLIEGVVAVGDPLQVLPVVYHALWAGRLEAMLDVPLHERVMVQRASGGRRGR